MMSRLMAFLLSSMILVQSVNIDSDDIMQLDELIEHAEFHLEEYGDNFFVFLSKHYGELKAEHSKKHQEEQKDHEQLPFQCQGHVLTIMDFVLQHSLLETKSLEVPDGNETNFHYLTSLSSLHKKDLLQPPKQV